MTGFLTDHFKYTRNNLPLAMYGPMMNTYGTEDSLIKAITSWIHYYNHGRIRYKLGWKTPY